MLMKGQLHPKVRWFSSGLETGWRRGARGRGLMSECETTTYRLAVPLYNGFGVDPYYILSFGAVRDNNWLRVATGRAEGALLFLGSGSTQLLN